MVSKEASEALFLYATEGVLVVNQQGEIVRINPSAENLFGYKKDELLGQKIEVLIPKTLSHKHTQYRDGYMGNPHARSMGANIDLKGLKKDGTEFPVEISLSPYTHDNGKFVIAFIIDITIRKQAEQKLKAYSAELEKQVKNRTLILEEAIAELESTKEDLHNALAKEKELSELKSRFVSMASHEFRTPLTTILSSLSLVTKYSDNNDKENQLKHVNKIKTSIHNLTEILNDFLSVSRFEEGKVENHPAPLNLKEYIDNIISEIKGLCKQGQAIVFDYSGSEDVVLDAKLLRHVLFNLLSNALKFSPNNSQVKVTANVDAGTIRIDIKDSGIGISAEDQQHLFERFFRGHNATHIQGTGLGLNIVANYVEMMSGNITFESAENKGTTFTLVFAQ
jgi:PAS domain S-box-containing protein